MREIPRIGDCTTQYGTWYACKHMETDSQGEPDGCSAGQDGEDYPCGQFECSPSVTIRRMLDYIDKCNTKLRDWQDLGYLVRGALEVKDCVHEDDIQSVLDKCMGRKPAIIAAARKDGE